MLENFAKIKITKMPTRRNVAGDVQIDPNGYRQVLFGRFRVITSEISTTNREELRSEQAMLWFPSQPGIQLFDVVYAVGRYWQIQRIDEARRAISSRIEFVKCWANLFEVIS